jgi:hypothetical protein
MCNGWPPLSDLPIKHLSQEHMQVLLSRCSFSKKVSWPELKHLESDDIEGHSPSSDSNETASMELEETGVKSNDQVSENNNELNAEVEDKNIHLDFDQRDESKSRLPTVEELNVCSQGDNGTTNQSDTEEYQWKLTKVTAIGALKKMRWAKSCSTKGCNLKAAVEYTSAIDQANVRNYCLDCQVRICNVSFVSIISLSKFS